MGNSLNIIIPQKDIEQVVNRAALAAASNEGKSNVAKIGNEALGCIKVSATAGGITFESSVSRFAAKIAVQPAEGVEIISEGEVCVPLKEFKQIVAKITSGYGVSLTFSDKLPTQLSEVPANMKNMLPVGTVDVGAVKSKNKKTVVKATMDAYSPSNFNAQAFPELSDLDVVFTGKASCLRTPYSLVSFSTNPNDPDEIFNKLAIFMAKDEVFFLGADGRRCALVKSPSSKFDSYTCIDEKLPLLIEVEYLTPVLASLSDDEPLTLAVERDRGHVYIISDRTAYRIAMVSAQSRGEYPAVAKIIAMEEGATAVVDRQEMLLALYVLDKVCCDRGNHTYGDKEVVISAQSIMAIKKADGKVPCEWTSELKLKRPNLCFHTQYMIEGLSKMANEKVKLMFTPDEKKVKIEDATDPQFSYYIRVIPPVATSVA